VVLALQGHAGILTLHLTNGGGDEETQEDEEAADQTYGDPQMDGKIVSLNEADFR